MRHIKGTNYKDIRITLLKHFLLILVLLITAFLGGACQNEGKQIATADTLPKNSSNAGKAVAADAKVQVTYFHMTRRCPTCKLLEEYSKETVEKHFTEELNQGKILFRIINLDIPENKHFVKDYNLVTKSLIVSLNKNQKEIRWKNLPDIWKHVRNRERFEDYVRSQIEEFLKDL